MSIQEARRPLFEKFVLDSSWPDATYLLRREADGYTNHDVNSDWGLWNAALDSVCVVLPGDVSLRQPSEVRDICQDRVVRQGIRCEVAKS